MIVAMAIVCVAWSVTAAAFWYDHGTLLAERDDARRDLERAQGRLGAALMRANVAEGVVCDFDDARRAKALVRAQSRARLAEARRWKARAVAAGWRRGMP